MTAAVTGASGHIGNNLCRELIKQGFKVKALIHNDKKAVKGLELEIITGSLSDKNDLKKLTENADIVFHLAAIISIQGNSKGILKRVNVEGTKNLIEASLEQGVKRFIHFSSIHALNQYPLNKELNEKNNLVEENAYAYDLSKAEAEKIVLDAEKKGLDAVILNPTSVIGINDYKPSLLGQAFIKIANGKLPALIPGGFDWVDVCDVVRAAVSAIDKGKTGERYLLSGNWHSLEELSSEINKHTKRKNPVKISSLIAKIGIPFIYIYSKIIGTTPLYTNESLNILAKSNKNVSSKKAVKELDYTVKPFPETIKDTFEWYKDKSLIHTE